MNLSEFGFKEQIPQNSAGFLKLPPISDPIPMGVHLEANKDASPPVLPPAVFL
jgi:hypothetical protein